MKLLDCTLRDGAHINAGRFSSKDIALVNRAFGKANIDFVELGFLQQTNDILATSFYPSTRELDEVVNKYGSQNCQYGFILRPGQYEIDALYPSKNLSFLRIAFYEEHMPHLERCIKKSQDLGYSVSLNPIGISTLSETFLKKIFEICNNFSVDVFSVVDTHGALRISTFFNLLNLLLRELNTEVKIGLHFHENLSLAQTLLQKALSIEGLNERLIVDASAAGMGRVPGNLPTELVIENFSDEFSNPKNLEPIYEIIPRLIEKYYDSCPWGYNYLYAKSAHLNISRSFPEYYIKKNVHPMKILGMLRKISSSENGHRFDEVFAEKFLKP